MSRLKAEYKRLKKLVKRNPILYVRLADIELQMGKVKEARNRLLNGLESDAENSTAYLLLAQAQGRLKDAEGSLKSYEEVLRLDPLNLRARKAYVELLHLLGRTDLEYAAHTRLYELSPSDTEIESKQKALVHWTMKQLFGDDFEWQDEWHPGDITEIGGLSTVVSKELELMPQRTALPKQFAPDVDDSLVTQMIARLPSTDDDEQVEEFKLPAQKAAAEESSNGTGEGEADSAVATEATTESEAENYDPDSNLIQHTDPVEPKPPAPEAETGAESVETDAETVAPSADDEDAAEPPAGETKPAAPVAEAEPATPEVTEKPTTADGKERNPDIIYEDEEEQEAGVEDILAELMNEGSKEDTEESEEHIPTPLEKAVQFGGQPLDHVVDFKQVLNELKQDELVLVENPDLEATVPEIQAPAKPETADEPEADETTDSGDEESNAEAPVAAEPEAVQQPNDEPAAETEAEVPKPEPEKQPSGALNQSDLDALLAQFQSGQAKPAASTSDSADAEDTMSEPETEAAAEEPEAAVEEDKPAEPSGPMNQGDLDALMASFKAGKSTPAPSTEEPATDTEPEPAEAEEPAAPAGPLDQNSLDELMAAFKKGSKTPAKSAEPEPPAESGEPVAEEPAAEEPEAEVTAQGEDDAPVDTPGESAPEAAKTPAEPAAKKAQERPPMPEASIPKKPASQEDLDDLISQFASKRRGKPGSQKPVEIGKYASRPKDDTESRQDDKKAGEPAADSAPEENITEGLKQKEEKVPELTEDELARRASYAMTPSRVEDEIESLEDNPDAEDETRDLSEADASHEDSFEPYGLSKSGSEPADQPPPDDKAESAPATEPAPESRTEPEASADPHPQPEPQTKAPRAAEPPAETSSEPEPQTKPEPSAAAESTSTPAPEKRSTPAPAPPPPAAQPKPKAESEPAAMAPRPKRTPPPQPKRDETAPEEYRGPVSKTLIRLQIGQGKYDHARAMLNRLRQQSPADPDLEKLAEQIEAAIS
ncbi:hypothetical protein KQI52_04000 [bacterium]|nr:hypothetical protein [bacterium]